MTSPAPTPARCPGDRPGRDHDLEQLVVEWLTDPVKPDHLRLDGPEGPATPLTTILGMVTTSPRTLSAHVASTLGLPPGTTLGEAATELLLAVNDPAGPRCRSYRAAVYYLHELHDLSAALTDF